MKNEPYKPDERLDNISKKVDASASKDSGKIVEVRKEDDVEDNHAKYVAHQQPFDEQMNESFDDLREDPRDEQAD